MTTSSPNPNFIVEACGKLTFPLGITCRVVGIPTTREEWLESYEEQIGVDSDTNIAIFTKNPDDWNITWEQVCEKADELKIQIPLNQLRFERNKKLSETDWVCARAVETGVGISTSWVEYRQALRDITNTYTSLDDVVWPVKP